MNMFVHHFIARVGKHQNLQVYPANIGQVIDQVIGMLFHPPEMAAVDRVTRHHQYPHKTHLSMVNAVQ
jgi:hypothetical protein